MTIPPVSPLKKGGEPSPIPESPLTQGGGDSGGLVQMEQSECLADLQFALKILIHEKWLAVGRDKMLQGLRVGAKISLNQTHHWEFAECDRYLDEWLADCSRPVYVYTSCLHKEAMLDLLSRLEAVEP